MVGRTDGGRKRARGEERRGEGRVGGREGGRELKLPTSLARPPSRGGEAGYL